MSIHDVASFREKNSTLALKAVHQSSKRYQFELVNILVNLQSLIPPAFFVTSLPIQFNIVYKALLFGSLLKYTEEWHKSCF